MSNTFEDAKSQRNWLERLGEKIPGYRGYQDRELRRDVDKALREALAKQLEQVKAALRDKARRLTDAGAIASLAAVGRLDQRLEGLAQSIRFTDYGVSGLFDPVKIGEEELARIHAFDEGLADDVATLQAAVSSVPTDPTGAPAALDDTLILVAALETKWASRERVLTAASSTNF